MQKIMDNDGAALNFGRFGCVIERKAKNPLTGTVPIQAKAFSLRIPLASTTKQCPLKGFFIAAVYEYGQDNQPNDISGNATRTCAGGDSGRTIALARELFSLFTQTFRTIVLRATKGCCCRKARDWLRKDTLTQMVSGSYVEYAWDELCHLLQDFTIRIHNGI